ncbi:MAG: SAM-dependent methyltransferase [Myxococcota bacterium]|jgi:SAM-dependent methyltransferase
MAPLLIHEISDEDNAHIIAGRLRCSRCTRDYPIIDGIPVILANLRSWIPDHLDAITQRDDLSASALALLGEGAGPGSLFDTRRSHLSSYGWGHWGDVAPESVPGHGVPGGLVTALNAGLSNLTEPVTGIIIDSGCAVGRSAFELAKRYPDALVVGVDVSFSFLKVAAHALRTGTVRYPVRRVGIVYDEHTFTPPLPGSERVDFWCADAQAFPVPAGTASMVTSLNVIDCVPSPRAHLEAIRDVLTLDGHAILATPFDWSPSATPMDEWIGGHAQLSALDGRAELAFDAIVGDHPYAIEGLKSVGTPADTDWWVRLHDRSTAAYIVRVATLQRQA